MSNTLFVKTAIANDGPRLKRIRPAPMGRAFRYQRRTSHISISVAERKALGSVDVSEGETAAPAKKKGLLARAAARGAAAKKAATKKAAAKKSPAKKKNYTSPKAGE